MTVTNEGTCQGTCDKFKSPCGGTQCAGIKVAKTMGQCKGARRRHLHGALIDGPSTVVQDPL